MVKALSRPISQLPSTPTSSHEPTRARRGVVTPLLLAGVVLAVVSGLGFAALYSGASDRVAALAVARPVAAGATIVPGDLREVELSRGPGVDIVAASRRSEMIGRRTAVALTPGSLLNEAAFANQPALATGQVVAAVALKAGQYPPELAPGDLVLVVGTGPVAGLSGAVGGTVLAEEARVSGIRIGSGPGGQAAVVSLVVERAVAPDLLAAASASQVGLVLAGNS